MQRFVWRNIINLLPKSENLSIINVFFANSAPDGCYMEIDGMDQSKTNLPHWPNMPKNIKKDLLMQIHVTGVRYSDGRKKRYLFVYKHFCIL